MTTNAERMQKLDDAWNARDWDTFDAYHEGESLKEKITRAYGSGETAVVEKAGSGLTIYFDTDDIDASLAKVRERGGKTDDKMPIPHVGWFAGCSDPDGNSVILHRRYAPYGQG